MLGYAREASFITRNATRLSIQRVELGSLGEHKLPGPLLLSGCLRFFHFGRLRTFPATFCLPVTFCLHCGDGQGWEVWRKMGAVTARFVKWSGLAKI